MKRKPNSDPVVISMRISQVRELISRLGHVHGSLKGHLGWANCECDLAKTLRDFGGAIHNYLKLTPKQDTPYQVEEKSPTRRPAEGMDQSLAGSSRKAVEPL